jgi:hypothetical protein
MPEDTRATIYTITCFQKLELDDRGWLRTGAQRTFGFYTERKDAIQAMNENWCDMCEYLYDYAVIEAMREGIHCDVDEEIWFQWNDKRKGFFEIPKPECVTKSHICNFALG